MFLFPSRQGLITQASSLIPPVISNKRRSQCIRTVSNRLHIKGLPNSLNLHEIYHFVSDYGRVIEIAAYNETAEGLPPSTPDANTHLKVSSPENESMKTTASGWTKKKKIHHNRPAGQTAIVTFISTNSAISCKEEIHWRPFPWNSQYSVAKSLKEDSLSTMNREQIHSTNPRDRPVLTAFFDTNFTYQRLRYWVKRDLASSKTKVSEWEKKEPNR
jgi:hypothetical protein